MGIFDVGGKVTPSQMFSGQWLQLISNTSLGVACNQGYHFWLNKQQIMIQGAQNMVVEL